MSYPIWFSVIYIIGAYIRHYPLQNHVARFLFDSKLGAGIMVFIAIGSVLIMLFLRQLGIISWWPHKWVADSNAPLAVLTSISLFNYFRNLEIRPSKLINTISASTFGVLLIHANSNAMRTFLWNDVCDCTSWHLSPWLPLYSVVIVLVVFVICTIIDMLRINFLEKPLMNKLFKS